MIVDDIVCGHHEIGWIAGVERHVLDANDRTGSVDEQSACMLDLTGGCPQIDRAAGCSEGEGIVLKRVIF